MKNRQAIARDHQEWRKTTGSQGPQQTAAVQDEKICDTVVFNHHAILSPILCTIPVQPNFINNTHP
jgi:hypothetical protein